MARETKYYFVDFAITPSLKEINPEEIVEFVKDGKSTENWNFMQIDGTIRYVFRKYNMPYPQCVFVNRNYKRTYEMDLVVVRENLKNEKEAMKWNVQRMFIQDELNRQAQSNSDDEGLKYKFEVI